MNIEQVASEQIEEFKKQMRGAVNDVLDRAYCEILPHVENDTFMNVGLRSQALIKKLLGGQFKKTTQENTIIVSDDNFIDVAITLTSDEYDRIRHNLISAMPSCPKDLEIEALKNKIAEYEKCINSKYW